MGRWCDCKTPNIRNITSNRCLNCGKIIRVKKTIPKEKKLDWTWAYIQDPLKEIKKQKEPINYTDEKTIEKWKKVKNAGYRPK